MGGVNVEIIEIDVKKFFFWERGNYSIVDFIVL